MSLTPRILVFSIVGALLAISWPGLLAADVAQARIDADRVYAAKLEELAKWCDEQGLKDQSATARAWFRPETPLTLNLVLLPDSADPEPAADAPAELRQWHRKFQALRAVQADVLFDLAKQAATSKHVTLAYELVWNTARENPDHKAARRILGYQPHEGRWRTPYEIGKANSKQVWSDKYGWLLKDRVARYDKGERFYKGRWMSASQADALAANMAQGWEVVTEHYNVKTNHSLEEGVRLAGKLERLYRAWQQLFVLFYASEKEVASWLDGAAPRQPRSQKHEVVYYRSRDEYNAALRQIEPQIGITVGYYITDKRTAYFFAGAEDDSSLNHEATHQLFSEVRTVNAPVGRTANFWVVEGIACYMESLAARNGGLVVGGRSTDRFRAAQFRLLQDNIYVPLDELVALSRDNLQRDSRIAMLYSEASGLTYFLIHYDNGRYRDALVDYLIAIYGSRDKVTTLGDVTGKKLSELDQEYREFMQEAAKSGVVE